MFGLEINQLADLLKKSDPNQGDSDSDEEQVIIASMLFFSCKLLNILAEEKSYGTFNSRKCCFTSSKH